MGGDEQSLSQKREKDGGIHGIESCSEVQEEIVGDFMKGCFCAVSRDWIQRFPTGCLR